MLQHHYKLSSKLFITAFLVFALASCTIFITKSKYMDEQEEKNSILIFGYINDKAAPFSMEWGDLKQVRPKTDEPIKDFRSNNEGLFYLENLPTGSFEIASVGGPERGLISNAYYDWNMPQARDDVAFRKRMQIKAKKPGLYFVGSYKINKLKDGGMFGTDKYETVITKEVSEKQALKKLLIYADGTKWKDIIRKRLKKLK